MNNLPSLMWLIKQLAKLGISSGGGESLTEASYSESTKKVTFTRNNGDTFTLDLATLQDVPPSVNTFADLPDVLTNINKLIIVRTKTGIIGINRKQQGTYYSNGVSWESSRINFNALYTFYDNSLNSLVSNNVKDAIDELQTNKVSVGDTSLLPPKLEFVFAGFVSAGEIWSDEWASIAWDVENYQFKYLVKQSWGWHDAGIVLTKQGITINNTDDISVNVNVYNYFTNTGLLNTSFNLSGYGSMGFCHFVSEVASIYPSYQIHYTTGNRENVFATITRIKK
tara:strand:+ start:6471 stop:7316 length:846 start_codon:yes stop_codon:yes gene_type:complete